MPGADLLGGCACGIKTLKKLSSVNRRLESEVSIGEGDVIYPSMLDDALHGIPDIVDYRVSLGKHGNWDQLHFTIEMGTIQEDTEERVRERLIGVPVIGKNIRDGKMAEPELAFVKLGELPKSGRAKKLIADTR